MKLISESVDVIRGCHADGRRVQSSSKDDRVGLTDGRTDGIAVANTALAMRTLRAVKIELSDKTVYDPVLKTTQLSAHAQNHASPERCRESFTMIFLGDHDFPITGSHFGNLTAFRAIFMVALCNRAVHNIYGRPM